MAKHIAYSFSHPWLGKEQVFRSVQITVVLSQLCINFQSYCIFYLALKKHIVSICIYTAFLHLSPQNNKLLIITTTEKLSHLTNTW